eukprot:1184950-Prorocentrum_minimum.AAC.5
MTDLRERVSVTSSLDLGSLGLMFRGRNAKAIQGNLARITTNGFCYAGLDLYKGGRRPGGSRSRDRSGRRRLPLQANLGVRCLFHHPIS